LERLREFFKKETVLCVAAVCAVVTMLFVPPDGAYIGYIDLRVLCLLLCLMAVVAGFQTCGAFRWLAFQLLRRSNSGRVLSVILVLLPFFSSMLVTNDVALLTFVPFTLLLLDRIGCSGAMIPMLVLQTIAANLGSMATPVGNPQNLFLYASYGLTAGEFFAVTLPLTVVSLVCLTAAALPVLPRELPELRLEEETLQEPKKLAVYGVLFVLCLLTVFHVLHYGVMTAAVLIAIAVVEPKLLRGLDIALLATFVCFFIVSGNLGRVEAVRAFLQELLNRSTLLTAVGTSQIISNVPAAVLLSGFTDQWRPLLEGVNLGGLGTPIASLASLITLKLYLRWPGAKAGRFLLVFTLANVAGLGILLSASALF
jgi:Na+/H+ antiporter NhaD/arsenite permease-like protein